MIINLLRNLWKMACDGRMTPVHQVYDKRMTNVCHANGARRNAKVNRVRTLTKLGFKGLVGAMALIYNPAGVFANDQSKLDFEGCEHTVTAHTVACTVVHFYRCASPNKASSGRMVFANSKLSLERLYENKELILEERSIFPEFDQWLVSKVGKNSVRRSISETGQIKERVYQVYDLKEPDLGSVSVIEKSHFVLHPEKEVFLGRTAQKYTWKTKRTIREAGNINLYWSATEVEGFLLPELSIYVQLNSELRDQETPKFDYDSTPTKILEPGEVGFEATETEVSCEATS